MSILTTAAAYFPTLMSDMACLAAPSAHQCQSAILAQVELIAAHVVTDLRWDSESIRYDVQRGIMGTRQLIHVILACLSDF